jgi:hypothetical protein
MNVNITRAWCQNNRDEALREMHKHRGRSWVAMAFAALHALAATLSLPGLEGFMFLALAGFTLYLAADMRKSADLYFWEAEFWLSMLEDEDDEEMEAPF